MEQRTSLGISNMDIKIVKPDGTEVEEIQKSYDADVGKLEGDNDGEINHIAVKQVLELERDDPKYNEDIDRLVRWAKSNGAKDYTEIKWAIRDLQMRLGTPTFGDHIKHLSRFAYLDLEEKRIKSEKEKYR